MATGIIMINCCIISSLLGSNLIDMLCEMQTTKMNVPLPVQLNFLCKEMGDANTSLAASIPGKNHNSGVKVISGPWLSSASEWKKQWSLISCLSVDLSLVAHGTNPVAVPSMAAAIANTMMWMSMAHSSLEDSSQVRLSKALAMESLVGGQWWW